MAELRLEEVEKSFGAVQVLKGISLHVPAGGFCVLVGSSGCGKSTLLRCLAGLELPTSGRIHLGEREITQLPPRERDIAMVFQSYALYPHLSVFDNLAFGLKLRKTAKDVVQQRVKDAAETLGLTDLLSRYPKELSGGQRQRVAMGRAIVRRPTLFLFDEPLSNLDAALRAEVRVQIRQLHDAMGATSVYVTHDQVEAMTLADVMVVLNKGKVAQAGPPLDIYQRPKNGFVARFLGSPAMSFWNSVARSPQELTLEDGRSFPLHTRHNLKPGQPVKLGIRAEDWRVDPEGAHPFKVQLCEALGGDSFVHLDSPAGKTVAKLDGRQNPARGQTLRLSVRPGCAHLFDGETEERIEGSDPPKGATS